MTSEDLRMFESHWLEQYWNAGVIDPKLLAKDFAHTCSVLAELTDELAKLREQVDELSRPVNLLPHKFGSGGND